MDHRSDQSLKKPLLAQAAGAGAGAVSINNDSDLESFVDTKSCAITTERMYVLVITSLMAFLQGGIWNTWGPIAPSVVNRFGWDDQDIALLANWGPICYFLAVLPSSWLMDVKGLRISMIVSMLLVVVGSGVRCIPTSDVKTFTYLVHFGQLVNGLAGPIAMSIPPVVSSTFFPMHQRTFATSVMTVLNNLGLAVSFVAGPQIVTNEHNCWRKTMIYLYGQTAFAALVLLCTLVYYPDKPSNAPSRSATVDRTAFWVGIRQLFRKRSFWCVAASYGVMTGLYSGWSAFLAPNLEMYMSKDDAQNEAQWLGFYSTLAGCAGGVALGLIADSLGGKMKRIILPLCLVAGACFLYFSLACMDAVPHGTAVVYTVCILGGLALNGTIPLYFESAVESAYPIAEGSTTCMLTVFNNLGEGLC